MLITEHARSFYNYRLFPALYLTFYIRFFKYDYIVFLSYARCELFVTLRYKLHSHLHIHIPHILYRNMYIYLYFRNPLKSSLKKSSPSNCFCIMHPPYKPNSHLLPIQIPSQFCRTKTFYVWQLIKSHFQHHRHSKRLEPITEQEQPHQIVFPSKMFHVKHFILENNPTLPRKRKLLYFFSIT